MNHQAFVQTKQAISLMHGVLHVTKPVFGISRDVQYFNRRTFCFVCDQNFSKSGSERLNSFEAKVSAAERLSRGLRPVEKENDVSSNLCQKCKREIWKMWYLTDIAGKLRENQ